MIDIFKTTTLDNLIAFSLGMFMASVIYYIIRLWTIEMPWAERTYDISKKKLEKFEDDSKRTVRQLDDNEIVNARILIDINKDLLWPYKQKGLLIENGKAFAIRDYDDYLNQVGGKK